MAVALDAAGMTSAIVPPPNVNGADPRQPARKRNATSMPSELLTAQHIVKTMNITLQAWYTLSLPYISDIGAMTCNS